ncbi:hypothetical protein [Pseudoruegeria sp. HB172150]|uniref:hypothetical protein n=1 Tax=Pseudoruegeria sp. HB172150 TaxID=2721164 RepID=UPI001555CBF3|nr:hypothetical protein [Pseudoruegeria sp. HB172150]
MDAGLSLMLKVRRERRRLGDLPPYLIEDMGLTPEEVDREANRWPWDLRRIR